MNRENYCPPEKLKTGGAVKGRVGNNGMKKLTGNKRVTTAMTDGRKGADWMHGRHLFFLNPEVFRFFFCFIL